jgi:hypothetical protein
MDKLPEMIVRMWCGGIIPYLRDRVRQCQMVRGVYSKQAVHTAGIQAKWEPPGCRQTGDVNHRKMAGLMGWLKWLCVAGLSK